MWLLLEVLLSLRQGFLPTRVCLLPPCPPRPVITAADPGWELIAGQAFLPTLHPHDSPMR